MAPPRPRSDESPPPPEKQTTAYDDDGTPTASLCFDLRRSLALIHEERHLVAYDLYREVLGRVEELDSNAGVGDGLAREASTTFPNSTAAAATAGTRTSPVGRGRPTCASRSRSSTCRPSTPARPRRVPFHYPLRRRQRQGLRVTPAVASDGADRIQDHRDAKVLLKRKEDEFTALEVSDGRGGFGIPGRSRFI